MAKLKEEYVINIHYPEMESDILELRKRMGDAYMRFVKDYILTLPIDNVEKNKLYMAVYDKVLENYSTHSNSFKS